MRTTILMLVFQMLLIGYFYLTTRSVVITLTVSAWAFTIYMFVKILFLCFRVPKPLRYEPITTGQLHIPDQVDREHPPQMVAIGTTPEQKTVEALINTLITKITRAADEGAIHTLTSAKFATLRRRTHERFSKIISEVNVIGFEGIVGTLMGLITFMAQASVLFHVPDMTQNSASFVDAMIQNLAQIDLLTVSTAFLTSILGWGVKAWLGQWIDERRGQEAASITNVESWIQDTILARLNLPTQVKTLLEFVNLPELHLPLTQAVGELKDASTKMRESLERTGKMTGEIDYLVRNFIQQLRPELSQVVEHLMAIGQLEFEVKHIDGGLRIIPRVNDRPRKTFKALEAARGAE